MSILRNLTNIDIGFLAQRLRLLAMVVLAGFLLRGYLFRWVACYKMDKLYPLTYKIEDARMNNFIINHPEVFDRKVENINEIALIAEKITADALEFSNTSTTINPNESFVSGNANDIGYSAFYKAVCNQLIRLYGYQDTYNCYHFVGSCYFINVNLSTMRSPYGGKPFPPEFHFNVIVNTNTHEFIAVDPSLYESYRIGTVVMDNARKP